MTGSKWRSLSKIKCLEWRRYEVVALSSDGTLYHTRKTDKYEAATASAVQWSANKQHPDGVLGFDFHSGEALLVLVGPGLSRSKDSSQGTRVHRNLGCSRFLFLVPSLDCE